MNVLRRLFRASSALVLLMGSSACTTLLPSGKVEVVSVWTSYEQGVRAFQALSPFVATRQDVHLQGLDPRLNPAIAVLHFGDVLQRFSAATLIKPDDVDAGIRECLRAGHRCSGYAVSVKKMDRRRVGNFWLDSLNFKRETVSAGWRVDALLVFVDDLLVYQLVGGQPTISEYEVQRNPLGPLQGFGELSVQSLH